MIFFSLIIFVTPAYSVPFISKDKEINMGRSGDLRDPAGVSDCSEIRARKVEDEGDLAQQAEKHDKGGGYWNLCKRKGA